MIKFIYDGTLDGLYTGIFYGYKDLESIDFSDKDDQLNFLCEKYQIKTDLTKVERVKNSLEKYFGKRFLSSIALAHLSYKENKANVIARTIKGAYIYGENFLKSADENALNFQDLVKNVIREIHSYKGLTRFREIAGGLLFAEIEAKNNITEKLARHFIRRMPKENFIIYDPNRSLAATYINSSLKLVDLDTIDVEEIEGPFENYWKAFYQAVKIEERENLKLMQSNMPKRYWKYLPERQD